MVIDLDNTQRMLLKMMMTMMMVIMMMTMINMIMKIKMIKTQLFYELGTPNFVWQQNQIVPKNYDNNYVDDDVDYYDNDDDDNGHNLANY